MAVFLALYLLVFHTPPPPSFPTSSYTTLYTSLRVSLTRAYVTFMRSPHAPFLLLEAALTLSGLALGLRGKTLALVLLAWIGYLILLKGSMLPFLLVLLLTLKVSHILLQGR